MSQGIDGSMATIHASDSRGAFGKLASYAAQAPERLSPASTAVMVANSVHLVIQLKWSKGEDKVRVVSSIREVTHARDEDVVSNEIFKPRSDRRGVFNVAPSDEKLELLEEAGFDRAWFDAPAWAS
jgi:Flp pilus assembly CpaF family ATPase